MNSSARNITALTPLSPGPIIVGYACVFLFGLLGHSYLGFKDCKRRNHASAFSHVLFRHLMFTEEVFTLTVPAWAYHLSTNGHLPDPWCRALTFVFYLTAFARAFFYLLLAWDRYNVIVCRQPLPVHPSYTQVVGLSVWLFAVLAASPFSIFSGDVRQCLGNIGVMPSQSSAILNLEVHLCTFWMPLVVTAACYYHAKRRAANDQIADLHRCALLVTIVMVFAIVWFPFHLVLLIDAMASLSHVEPSSATHWAPIVTTCESLAFAYVGVSPLVYLLASPVARNDLIVNIRPFFWRMSGKQWGGYVPVATQPSNKPDEETTPE
ncbi:membrane protein US27A [Mandrillus leucophaeus cytomegalovirus]|uniref:Membrane protein US27A n=1 Tax=Mandrillus leucophaeus cytomegalovirus TaxID=1654930 RepID=A0A0G2UGF6_9BETA|nr:membrane protein US27A [Mandrillus leucophaeus cytomegalovirus]AKI29730.1 membrane protein US27A [Mandrillus leucophaeus cytomegalovirus]